MVFTIFIRISENVQLHKTQNNQVKLADKTLQGSELESIDLRAICLNHCLKILKPGEVIT